MNNTFLSSLLGLSFVLFLTSCAGSLFKPTVKDLSSEYDEIRNYAQKKDISANIGDVMIVEETGHFYKGYRLSGPVTYKEQKAFRGQVWIASHKYEGSCEDGSLIVTGGAFQKAGLGVVINDDGAVRCPSPVVSIAEDDTRGDAFSFEQEGEVPAFVPMKGGIPDYEKGAKRIVMMYGGNSDNTIFIFYREFDGNPFFPTKSQDLSYELEPNGIFESQGKTFEVQTIKGSTITFQVLKEPEVETPASEASPVGTQNQEDIDTKGAGTAEADEPEILEAEIEDIDEQVVDEFDEEVIEEEVEILDDYALPGT